MLTKSIIQQPHRPRRFRKKLRIGDIYYANSYKLLKQEANKLIPMLFFLLILTALSGLLWALIAQSAGLPAVPEGTTPKSPRWHTGFVRAAKMLAICQVGSLILLILLMIFKPNYMLLFWPILLPYLAVVIVFVWGLLAPRQYSDGKDRNRFSHLLSLFFVCGLQSLLLFISLCGIFLFQNMTHTFIIRGATRTETPFSRFGGGAQWLADTMVPDGAKDITFYYNGNFLGYDAELRCTCTQEELLAFAEKNDYVFQSESIELNARTGQKEGDWISRTWCRFHPNHEENFFPAEEIYPKNFLAYNYRFSNFGGYSFLYDVESQTLYANYSSR